jgi:proteasome lid subunit RPN8/RPN11
MRSQTTSRSFGRGFEVGTEATRREMEISAEHYAHLRHTFEAAYPRECCGVLLGSRDGTHLIVQRVVSTVNAFNMVGGFAIPDHEMRRVRLLAAEAGLSIVAVFHSHPSGSTELSSNDRAALEHSEWPWVIVTENRTTQELQFTWYSADPRAAEAQTR